MNGRMITRLRREARRKAFERGERSSEGIYRTLKAQYKEERRMRPMPEFMRLKPTRRPYDEEGVMKQYPEAGDDLGAKNRVSRKVLKDAFSPGLKRRIKDRIRALQHAKRKARNGNSRQRRRDKING